MPGPNRVVGGKKNTEANLREYVAAKILFNQKIEEYERPKTLEENSLVEDILTRIPNFISEYGAEATKVTLPKQIHMLDASAAHEERVQAFLEKGVQGGYNELNGRIEALSNPENIVATAKILVHELMHANSFQSLTVTAGVEAQKRRFGFSLYDGKNAQENQNAFFEFLNEAITEELAKRFCERFLSEISVTNEQFSRYRNNRKSAYIFPDITRVDPLQELTSELEWTEARYSYYDERMVLVSLIQVIFLKNPQMFRTYEDVFKMFSKAMFTGRLLEVARLIEKTFGKGAFKKIGELTMESVNENNTEKFIEFLDQQEWS
ncbi:MAG: hypothetical protein WC646_01330 [Candidatus Paceibacterota bacterium]